MLSCKWSHMKEVDMFAIQLDDSTDEAQFLVFSRSVYKAIPFYSVNRFHKQQRAKIFWMLLIIISSVITYLENSVLLFAWTVSALYKTVCKRICHAGSEKNPTIISTLSPQKSSQNWELHKKKSTIVKLFEACTILN